MHGSTRAHRVAHATPSSSQKYLSTMKRHRVLFFLVWWFVANGLPLMEKLMIISDKLVRNNH